MSSNNVGSVTGSANNSSSPGGALSIDPVDNIVVSQPVPTQSTNEIDSTTRFLSHGDAAETSINVPKASGGHVEQLSTIKAFLAKPYLISAGTWTTGWTYLYTPSGWNSIGAYLASVGYWANKIQGFENIRGTAKLRIVLNANPMQQGKLKLCWWPSFTVNAGGSKYQTLCALSQLPGVEVNCSDNEAILEIPYVGPFDYYNLKRAKFDWGAWGLFVMSPLLTGAAGENSVSYNIFLSFTDVELVTPLVPQSGSSALTVPTRSRFKAEKSGSSMMDIFDSALRLSSKLSSSFLAPVVSAAPWVQSFLAGDMTAKGFSKPPTNELPKFVSQVKAPFMANSTGVTTAIVHALRHDNMLDLADISVNGIDEMSFDYLKQVPAMIDWFDLSTGDSYNASVWASLLSVQYASGFTNMTDYSITNGGHTAVIRNYSPIGFLSRYFRFARGCLRVTLKFVKTNFHTGRYIVTWTPSAQYTTAPTATTSILSLREVIDLSSASEVTFDLPYLYPYQFIDLVRSNGSMGHLDVICATPLRCPETCSSSVRVLVYISGGEDFELAGFNTVNKYGGSINNYQPALYAQSGNLESTFGETMVRDTFAGISCDSNNSFIPHRNCVGEAFIHLRQLFGKYSNITFNTQGSAQSTLATDINGQAFIAPYSILTRLPAFTTAFGFNYPSGACMLSELMYGFSFYRGSLRLVIGVDTQSSWNTNLIGTTLVSLDQDGAAQAGAGTWINSDKGGTLVNLSSGAIAMTTLPYLPNESSQFHNTNTGIAEVQIPYYSQYRLAPCIAEDDLNYTPHFGVQIRVFGATSATTLQTGLAAGDDFQVTLFTGFPGVLISYA